MNTENVMRRTEAQQPERMSTKNAVAPRVDIYENADEFLVVVDLPGVSQEHLRIDLDKGQLLLHAERSYATNARAAIAEFGPRTYQRIFALPRGVDAERVAAELKDGVLTLHLPKIPALKPRRIAVTAS